MKALAREMRGSAHLGLTLEMLVADPERGYRDRGAPSNTSHDALLDYASSNHGAAPVRVAA